MDPELKTFDEQMDFLAADEEEAIAGYEKVIALVEDEHVKEQLAKILAEEQAHRAFLKAVKKDPSLIYNNSDIASTEEQAEMVTEEPLDFEWLGGE